MDAKSRKALIKSLAKADKFDPLFSDANRRWMAGKTLAVIESRGTRGDIPMTVLVNPDVTILDESLILLSVVMVFFFRKLHQCFSFGQVDLGYHDAVPAK